MQAPLQLVQGPQETPRPRGPASCLPSTGIVFTSDLFIFCSHQIAWGTGGKCTSLSLCLLSPPPTCTEAQASICELPGGTGAQATPQGTRDVAPSPHTQPWRRGPRIPSPACSPLRTFVHHICLPKLFHMSHGPRGTQASLRQMRKRSFVGIRKLACGSSANCGQGQSGPGSPHEPLSWGQVLFGDPRMWTRSQRSESKGRASWNKLLGTDGIKGGSGKILQTDFGAFCAY